MVDSPASHLARSASCTSRFSFSGRIRQQTLPSGSLKYLRRASAWPPACVAPRGECSVRAVVVRGNCAGELSLGRAARVSPRRTCNARDCRRARQLYRKSFRLADSPASRSVGVQRAGWSADAATLPEGFSLGRLPASRLAGGNARDGRLTWQLLRRALAWSSRPHLASQGVHRALLVSPSPAAFRRQTLPAGSLKYLRRGYDARSAHCTRGPHVDYLAL